MYRLIAILALTFVMSSAFAVTGKICIDPGHGGTDPGAVGCSQYEDNNNLNTCLKFKAWMDKDTNDGGGGGSWTIVMTRTTDVYVSLSGRCSIANNNYCNSFLSIHNNACGCGATGTETFCHTSLGSSANLRNKVQSRMLAAWGLTNRGNKTATYYVLAYTNMEATLTELGFIDTCSPDAAYTGNSTHQDNAGKAHMYAVQAHYGLAAYTPVTSVTYTNDAPDSCSSNWSTGTSATDKYGADYRYRSTAALSDAAAFNFSIATAGNYDVSAWWPAGTNRSATAPFIIPNGGGTVNVNQQINGGKWNWLKTQSVPSGANTVQVSCWTTTGFVVMADAVKMYGPK